jgi:hypothetical protein
LAPAPRSNSSRSTIRRLSLVLLSVFVLLAGMYSLVVPSWEAPDEVGHFAYIAHLLKTRTLPVQHPGETGEAHQPPLYYLAAALAVLPANLHDPSGAFRLNPRFVWADQGGNDVNISQHNSDETFPFQGQALALHLARGVSVLMGAVTVALVMGIGWAVFPSQPAIGLLAAALIAFNPQFLFFSSTVSNDNLLVMAATGAWWQLLRAMKRPEQGRQWIYVSIWVALAVCAESSGFVVALVAGLVLLACAVRRRSAGLFVRGAAALVLTLVLLTGWWFVRNQVLYGDPLGWSVYDQVYGDDFRQISFKLVELKDFFYVQFRSFWGVFGWMNVPSPAWFYIAFLVLVVLSFLSLAFAVRRWRREWSDFQRAALAVLGLAIVVQEAFMLWVITRYNASFYQGRYLFPVIGPLMVLMSLGIVNLLPQRHARTLATGLVIVLASLALVVPFHVIRPAYAIVPLPKWRLWFVPNKTQFVFGDLFELKGYKVDAEADGLQVRLTLYWQALQPSDFDYSVFVHLVDSSDQMVAQKDQGPGQDQGYPPTAWWPGDIIADEHVIQLPAQLPAGTYRFRVGVYNWATGEQLRVSTNGQQAGSFVILDQVLRHEGLE